MTTYDCQYCGLPIVYGSKLHIPPWDCNRARENEIKRLNKLVDDAKVAIDDAAQWGTQKNPECGHPKACLIDDEMGDYCEWCSDVNGLQDQIDKLTAKLTEVSQP